MQEDLKCKLQALGFRFGSELGNIQKPNTSMIDRVIDGSWLDEINRTVYIHKKSILYDAEYGNKRILYLTKTSDLLEYYGIIEKTQKTNIFNFVFLDTETTSLGIGSGSYIFLIGICFFTKEGLSIEQIFLENPAHEEQLLAYIDNKLKRFSYICTFNGKSFDFPILRTRFILNKLLPEFSKSKHIDVLHISRRLWGGNFETCKLSVLEKEILGFQRGAEEIPGWLVPQIYLDYLRSGDPISLRGVFYHNECDIISLALLFSELAKMFHVSLGNSNDLDKLHVASAYWKNRSWEKTQKIAKKIHADQFTNQEMISHALLMGRSLKKLGKIQRAINWFEKADNWGSYIAAEELAKYHEHIVRNNKKALEYAKHGFDLVNNLDVRSEKNVDSFKKRISRLQRKTNE